MPARRLLVSGVACVAIGCTQSAPTPPPSADPVAPPGPAAAAEAGARSAEELKERFLRHVRANDKDAVMALFYLKGASKRIVDLYRVSIPSPDREPIDSAEVLGVGGDRRPSSPHTLKPEQLLLLRFREGSPSVEQYFYIGRHEGRYYFTLPSDG